MKHDLNGTQETHIGPNLNNNASNITSTNNSQVIKQNTPEHIQTEMNDTVSISDDRVHYATAAGIKKNINVPLDEKIVQYNQDELP